jgi:hypothetical protein
MAITRLAQGSPGQELFSYLKALSGQRDQDAKALKYHATNYRILVGSLRKRREGKMFLSQQGSRETLWLIV